MSITIVTGNPGKVRELESLSSEKLSFTLQCLEIDEIQSLDLENIVKDKAKKAYALVNKPIIVEDVSAGLASLNGLPGPFIKFFNKSLGSDALYKLSHARDEVVTVRCLAAYFDGSNFIIGEGIITGTIVSPRGDNGFGFDAVIVPKGETKTMAEMSPEQKIKISHRGKAFRSLIEQLEN